METHVEGLLFKKRLHTTALFKISFLIFSLVLMSPPAPSCAENKGALTLKSCIQQAILKSPLLESKRHGVTAFKEGVLEKKGALFPRIDFHMQYKRTSDPQVVVPIKSFKGAPPTFSRDIYSADIGLSLPIYEGGRLRTSIEIAKIQELMARDDLALTKEEVAYLTRIMFYQCVYLDELRASQEENLKALKRLRSDSERKLELGRLRPVDLMRIDAAIGEEEASLIKTIQERRRASHLLSRLMGDTPSDTLPISGRLDGLIQEGYDIKDDISVVKAMVEERPDVQLARSKVKLKENMVRLEKGLNYPVIALVGEYGRRAASGFEADEEVWQGGISLSLNIFSGGVIKHRVQKACYEYLAAKDELNELVLRSIQEVKDAISRIHEAKAKIASQSRSVKAAKESFRIERLRYETGAGVITDVLLSESKWLAAKAGLIGARFELEQGKAELDRSLGRTIKKILQEE